MSTETTQENVQPDYLNMSDEELNNMDVSSLGSVSVEEEKPAAEQPQVVDTVVDDEVTPEKEVTKVDNVETVGTTEPPEVVVADKDEKPEPVVTEAEKPAEVDYKALYEAVIAPFKANGKEMSVSNPDDARSLMQMGANYNKKMAALKPSLKLMKLLENNGLLSEEKIGFLIDLEKKNPDAINKLVKESGMDPMDLDAEKASGYKPNTYTVDDREIELDTVLDEIQGTPSYNRTLEIVSTKWDSPSKQVIASSPQLLKVINDHVQRGVYDIIIQEVESEKMFGRLNGLSDIEAYRQVGDAIEARNGFASLNKSQQVLTKAPVAPPKPKVDEDKLNEKRRAASSTKPAGSSAITKEFNPLAMSDEEFSKQINQKFL